MPLLSIERVNEMTRSKIQKTERKNGCFAYKLPQNEMMMTLNTVCVEHLNILVCNEETGDKEL